MITARTVSDSGASDAATAAPPLALAARPAPIGTVLVATDGTPASDAALRCAAELARTRGAVPRVVTVVDPLPAFAVALDPLAASAAAEVYLLEPRDERLAHVRQQLRAAVGADAAWPVTLLHGSPAALIADEASRRRAALVVTGLRPHSAVERVFRDEIVLRVMRRAGVPVLAATAALGELPSHVVAAVDFSRASVRAAKAALSLVAPGGQLSLVHVNPRAHRVLGEEAEGAAVIYAQGVAAAFTRLRAELRPPADVSVRSVVLDGDPAEELLSFAARSGAQLIAAGSQRHALATRMTLGSVTATLVRSAQCSLLVTPPVHETSAPNAWPCADGGR